MDKETFQTLLTKEVESYKSLLETKNNDWIVKGFIDVNKNVYTITNDTKVVSKIIEIILIPHLDAFAKKNGMTLELPSAQNYYPDLTFKDGDGNLFGPQPAVINIKVELLRRRPQGERLDARFLLGILPSSRREKEYGPSIQ